ncbi:MAG: hypothetical protein C3F11_01905 [Methylocystaceae bacterium]|nr:MAG: hypothetical protein C3F11_01905 [Methylocystaceae bacterium]
MNWQRGLIIELHLGIFADTERQKKKAGLDPMTNLRRLIEAYIRTKITNRSNYLAEIAYSGPGHLEAASVSIFFEPIRLEEQHGFVEFDVTIDPDDYSYDYSKLYYCSNPEENFSEERAICFKLRQRRTPETVRLVIPTACSLSAYLRMRLDLLPYTGGHVLSSSARLVNANCDDELSRKAKLILQKEWVRAEVLQSEAACRTTLPHYPESLSLELTAGCNLTCSHCSSHGDAAEHELNIRRPSFNLDMLDRLAHELFPHLTMVNLVGRGEPMMVPDQLWNRLAEHLDRYHVLMTCVTNGYFLRRRLTEKVLPLVDTITVSIDGATEDVFAQNRGNGRLSVVLDNVKYFNDLRHKLPLARRPRLGFSWTLKRNNIHEFPEFIRLIKRFDPTLLYVRHLFVFREKDQEQSLLGQPDLTNRYLREAYALLEGSGIKLDVPPLMK